MMKHTIIRTLACTLVVLVLIGTATSCGKSLRIDNETSASSAHFDVSKEQMNVHRYLVGVQEMSYYYEQLYLYRAFYGKEAEEAIQKMDPFGDFLTYVEEGRSPTTYIHDHIAEQLPKGRFDRTAYDSVTRYLAYCEGAREEGLYDGYLTAAAAKVDKSMENLRGYAEELDISFDKLLGRYIGKGVTEQDVREALELREVAALHSDALHRTYAANATEAELDAYMLAHKEEFYSTSYYTFPLADAAMVEYIRPCASVDEVPAAVAKAHFDSRYERLYRSAFEGEAPIHDPDPTKTRDDILETYLALCGVADTEERFAAEETDDYRKAARRVAESVQKAAVGSGEDASTVGEEIAMLLDRKQLNSETAAYKTPTAEDATLQEQWLFYAGRRKGDFTVLPETKTSPITGEASETVYTLFIIDEIMILDTERTCDAYYIRLLDDADSTPGGLTALGKAEKLYEKLKGTTEPEAFAALYEELLAEYMPGYSAEAREMISYDSLDASATPLAEWLFDEIRAPGDMAIFPPDEDEDLDEETSEGHYFVYFIERNDRTWLENSRAGVGYDKLEAYCKTMTERHDITVDFDPDHLPETESAT